MNTAIGHRWYVVRTQPHAENKASASISAVRVLRPICRAISRSGVMPGASRPSRRRCSRAISSLRSIGRRSAGVASVRRSASAISCAMAKSRRRFLTDVIDALREREDESGLIRLPARPRFATGDKVRLLDGAFARLHWAVRGHEGYRAGVRASRFARAKGSGAARRGRCCRRLSGASAVCVAAWVSEFTRSAVAFVKRRSSGMGKGGGR